MGNERSFTESKRVLDQATFNLKAVVRETGLKPDTLRAWERRYKLPNPARTAGGHRLYSQYDIDIIKWLMARQDEGLSISLAVGLWQKMLKDGKDPLHELPLNTIESPPTFSIGETIVQSREQWVTACMGFDEQSAENALSQAFSMFPPEIVCIELLQRGLAEIGMGWYEGKVTAQQEHFASSLAMRRLESLVSATPPPTRPGRILIGCAPEEEHTFGSLLLTLLLRRRGWEALYLGANVPLARLEATMAAAEPRLVILTAQTLYTAATLFEMAEVLKQEGVMLAFGGLIFSIIEPLRQRIPGHFLGARLQDSPAMVEQILSNIRPLPTAIYADSAYEIALDHYLEKRSKIESIVWDTITAKQGGEHKIRPKHLAHANRDLARSITAALTLGDMGLIGHDMAWIEGLLMNFHYRMPRELLHAYVRAYHHAINEALNEDGQLITKWLKSVLES